MFRGLLSRYWVHGSQARGYLNLVLLFFFFFLRSPYHLVNQGNNHATSGNTRVLVRTIVHSAMMKLNHNKDIRSLGRRYLSCFDPNYTTTTTNGRLWATVVIIGTLHTLSLIPIQFKFQTCHMS